ncbi:MAG: hypothetical protein ACTSQB_00930, partial [Candidatus Heimdallarchaeota archaeon]
FRTISQGIHFMADSYPTEDAEQMISSIKAVFEEKLEGSDHKVVENNERPSITIRLRYFKKTPK